MAPAGMRFAFPIRGRLFVFHLSNIRVLVFQMKHSSGGPVICLPPDGEGGTECRIGVLSVKGCLFVLSLQAISEIGDFRLFHMVWNPIESLSTANAVSLPHTGEGFLVFRLSNIYALMFHMKHSSGGPAICLPQMGKVARSAG